MGEARLTGADLCGANLRGADLRWADLTLAFLTRADLTGAKATAEQLAKALSLKGATLPDGSVHEWHAGPIDGFRQCMIWYWQADISLDHSSFLMPFRPTVAGPDRAARNGSTRQAVHYKLRLIAYLAGRHKARPL